MRLAESITTKNITSVDEVQSVDNTDKVFVNDNGSFKQVSISNLMKRAPAGITQETDPTVSEWAKQPTKPSYTAHEVGALPVGTKIPTKTSDLTNDSGYLTQIPEEYVTETELGQKGYVIEDDIPEKLPSPGTLTFTGAVNDTYDGSTNKTINIPTGGGEGGTSDYNALANKPKLNGVEIAGSKTSTDYKIVSSEQGIENNGKFLGVGVDGNVTPVDKPTYTADEVGARPDTWTPSAEDVGALPNNTEIPSKTSDLENDSGFITNSDIPEKLPNPQKIIFTGAVSAEYDGSSQQTINIPTGGGSDPYTLPIMSDTQLGGGKAVEKTDEDVPVAVDPSTGQLFVPTYPENTGGGGGTVDPEQIKQVVNDYLEENPVSGMTAEQEQQLNQNTTDVADLKSGLEKIYTDTGVEYHEYTEAEIEIKRTNYNKFYNGVESTNGSGTSTVLFKTPQKIRIENNHTQDITVTGSRFANSDDYESATYIPGSKNDNARREGSFLSETIPMGESVVFDTYEYGSSGAEYIQLRFQPGAWSNAWNNIKVYAIYDSWRPTYTLPEVNGIYEEDIPVRYTFQGTNYAINSQELIAVAPYYPDFTYNIRGGNYENSIIKTLDVIYLMDNSIFDGYHDNIFNRSFTSGHKDIPCIFPEKTTTTQYDTSVNAGANSDYAWAYFKTPPETELIGPKWVAIIGMYAINHSASEDLGQEYYNEQIRALNDRGPQLRYVTKFNDKNAPRRLLSTYVKRVDKQSDGTYYTSILKQSDNPLAGKKWTLFGDSLTDVYGGHDLTGNYFASKIAREFGMNLDNRAKGGGNINTGANGNYTNINGCECLDQLISDVEGGLADPPDYITVAYGTNGIKTQNGTADDTSANKETTCGAVKYFIEKCTEKFPNAFLGFVLPPLGSWKAEDGQQFPNENKDIDAAREAIKSVLDLPEYGGIPYIDMSKKTGITLAMLPDKIHISTDQTNAKYYRALRGFLISAGV